MAEEILGDSFPDLNELENKIGRKTPESLLIRMRDAAEGEDGWGPEAPDGGDRDSGALRDSLRDKISTLKQEMRWLRSADVRILRQLVAVHEGIEAIRWLMEEKGSITSRGSSLTGSLSSLVTAEEHGPSMSPCRKSPSPVFPLDVTEITSEKAAADQKALQTTLVDPGHFELNSSEAGPPVRAGVFESQKQGSGGAQLQNIKSGAETIRRALLRSSRARRHLKADSGSFALGQQSERKVQPAQESFTSSQNNTTEKRQSSPTAEAVLLGYDAQWCWVESQDDVTFL